ncbi:MAG: alpha/beta hydrolase [Actinobacteria bacterium]|nr:alpha/beta hydrolase [Actinomycetota bacterium]MCL6104858.1 alpha/beta hydrolase [Actinomycetota bacterium]
MPEKSFRSFDGIRLVYDDRRMTTGVDNGLTVLLLHGFAADSHITWEKPKIADALVNAGYRVLSFDARGHGRSDKPHEVTAYSDDAMVKDAEALLDYLGFQYNGDMRVVVMGYSMGGVIALQLAQTDTRVIAAVLGGVGKAMADRDWTWDAQLIAEALSAPSVMDVADARGRAYRQFAQAAGGDLVALAATQRALPYPLDINLSDTKVPVLVIAGNTDKVAGSPTELAALIGNARSVTVNGNHMNALFDPQFIASVLEFLADVYKDVQAEYQQNS